MHDHPFMVFVAVMGVGCVWALLTEEIVKQGKTTAIAWFAFSAGLTAYTLSLLAR